MNSKSKACLPNFFIVGAAKAGTTSLAKYIQQHPDIFIPNLKEPKFFSHPDNVFPHNGPGDQQADTKVIKDFGQYLALFQPGISCRARGDASIDYLFFDNVPHRIYENVPNATILIILRNPVDRAFSAYMHMFRDGRETLSFEEALEAESSRKSDNWEFFWRYTELGFYSLQVKRYLDMFGKDQVFVLLYDEFTSDPVKFCQAIFKILGVDADIIPNVSDKYNISGKPKYRALHTLFNRRNIIKSMFKPLIPKQMRIFMQKSVTGLNLEKNFLNRETRKILLSLYADDVLQLEKMLGINLQHWLIEGD